MRKEILFNPLVREWNSFLKPFKNLDKRITSHSHSEQQETLLTKKINRASKRIEKAQDIVGLKMIGMTIAIMLFSFTSFAQNSTQLPNLTMLKDIVAGTYSKPVFADIDEDNDLDLYIGEANGNINVFINDGNGNFSIGGNLQADGLDINMSRAKPVFADIDGDNDLDLYVGSYYGNISVFTNDGDGNFTSVGNLQADDVDIAISNYTTPVFADIDKDNDLDLYVGETNGNIKVFINTGGVFFAGGNLQAGSIDIDTGDDTVPVFADLNGDNNLDLYIGQNYGFINVYINDGNGNFTNVDNLHADGLDIDVGSNSAPAFADIDGDNDLDLYVGEFSGYINVYTNDGSGNFTSADYLQFYGTTLDAGYNSDPVFADIDEDNDLDLYIGVGYGVIKVFRNDGNGNYTSDGNLKADGTDIDEGDNASPVFADIDKDNDLDLYVGSYAGSIKIFLNDGDGNFTSASYLQADGSYIDVGSYSTPAFADIDGDGDLDLYTGQNYGFINIFINDGNGNFSNVSNLQADGLDIDVGSNSAPTFVDINGDNDLDLYVGEKYGGILAFINDGNGNFSRNGNLQVDGLNIDIEDDSRPTFVNIDGEVKLFVGDDSGKISVFELILLPVITTQPTNQTNVCLDAVVNFSVIGENIDSYKWQTREDDNSTWLNLSDNATYSGTTTYSLTVTSDISLTNYQYSCTITNINGNLISNVVSLSFDTENPTITCVGNQEVTATGITQTYTVTGTEFDPVETADNCEVASVINNINGLETLAGVELSAGTTPITWTVTDVMGNESYCNFNVLVNELIFPTIIDQPENQIQTCPNDYLFFTITGNDIDSYQWQVSEDEGGTWSILSNNTTYEGTTGYNLFVIADISLSDYQYSCIITNENGSLTSNAATLSFDTELPTVTCVEDKERTVLENTQTYTITGYEFDLAQSYDNCSLASVVNNINGLQTLAGAELPIGLNTIIWTVTDVMGNESVCSFDVLVNDFVNIENLPKSDIVIYPNPTTGKLTINNSKSIINNVVIIDITGKTIKQLPVNSNQLTIDISSYPNGIYFIKLQNNEGIETRKIIKQ